MDHHHHHHSATMHFLTAHESTMNALRNIRKYFELGKIKRKYIKMCGIWVKVVPSWSYKALNAHINTR